MHILPIILISLASFFWVDGPVATFFTHLATLRGAAVSITWLCLPIMHLSISGSLFLVTRFVEKFKSYTMPLFQYFVSVGFIMFVCGLLKLTIARARPHLYIQDGFTGFAFGNFGNSFRSFPSSHTAIAVALAVLVVMYFGQKYRLLAWGFVGLIAVTRMILQKHFVSDILIGALIGEMVTMTVIALGKKHASSINAILERVL